tara:strand:- start:8149 stop:9519 length:1371 start_codon:yes stop_codon:yes gene_type:complete
MDLNDKDFLNVVKSRRSVRHYLNKDVDNKIIRKIIEAGIWAPTTCNQQLWNFVIVKDPKIKDRLVNEAASSTMVKRSPVIIIISYEKSNYKEAIQSATGAMENILLASTYYGLGSCSMNSFGNEDKIKEILKISQDQLISCIVTLGYTDKKFYEGLMPPPRRKLDTVLHWDNFKNNRKNVFSYNPDRWTLSDLKDYQRYFCRKTSPGKEMDISTIEERYIVSKYLKKIRGPILDWLTYDGSYLKYFPDIDIHTIDLTDETSKYSKIAFEKLNEKKSKIKNLILGDSINELKTNKKFNTITAIFKFERLSKRLMNSLLEDSKKLLSAEGELLVIFRKKSILYRLFYFLLKVVFKDDIRKTGIYSFFGPYRPIHSKKFIKLLEKKGFKNIRKECYYPFPTFFSQAYQMYLQFKLSGGSSYLHRIKRENLITKILTFLINIYKHRKTPLGSVCVVRANK